MQWSDRLGLAQRIVVVVALAFALEVTGTFVTGLGGSSDFGWFGYAPLTGVSSVPSVGLRPWERALIWLALIGFWAVVSVLLLRPSRQADEETTANFEKPVGVRDDPRDRRAGR